MCAHVLVCWWNCGLLGSCVLVELKLFVLLMLLVMVMVMVVVGVPLLKLL